MHGRNFWFCDTFHRRVVVSHLSNWLSLRNHQYQFKKFKSCLNIAYAKEALTKSHTQCVGPSITHMWPDSPVKSFDALCVHFSHHHDLSSGSVESLTNNAIDSQSLWFAYHCAVDANSQSSIWNTKPRLSVEHVMDKCTKYHLMYGITLCSSFTGFPSDFTLFKWNMISVFMNSPNTY